MTESTRKTPRLETSATRRAGKAGPPASGRATSAGKAGKAGKLVAKPGPKMGRKLRPIAAPTVKHLDETTEGLEGALRALHLALDKKALEPVLLDVRELCTFCNYQLIVSGRSDRQVDAISDGISAGLRDEGYQIIGSEGARTGQWGLLDYGDFVVHVFLHDVRDHYDLEGLWSDAPRIPVEVPAEARVSSTDAYAP